MGEAKIEKLIGQKELSEVLGLTKRGIENLRKESGLPYYKVGSLIRFRLSEVEKWLKERRNG